MSARAERDERAAAWGLDGPRDELREHAADLAGGVTLLARQIETARLYRAAVEEISAGGGGGPAFAPVRVDGGGGGGHAADGGVMRRVVMIERRDRAHQALGEAIALPVTRRSPSRADYREPVRLVVLVNATVIGGHSFSDVLAAHNWPDSGRARTRLRDALAVGLDAIAAAWRGQRVAIVREGWARTVSVAMPTGTETEKIP